jgi:hypothetical protein
MNTHDRIELPPLPYPYTTPAYKTVKAVIQEYTRAAIKADRQRWGEPVSKTYWNNELSSWSDEDFIRIFHERPDLAKRLRKMLADPVKVPPAIAYCQHPHCQTTGGCQGPCSKKQAEPVKVNAVFETENGEIVGTTDAKVKRVEWQDDGSLTVVIDYWPQPTEMEDPNTSPLSGKRSTTPEGWQLVPKEPTDEMKKAGCQVPLNKAARHNACYKAMLAAAPQQPSTKCPGAGCTDQGCPAHYATPQPDHIPDAGKMVVSDRSMKEIKAALAGAKGKEHTLIFSAKEVRSLLNTIVNQNQRIERFEKKIADHIAQDRKMPTDTEMLDWLIENDALICYSVTANLYEVWCDIDNVETGKTAREAIINAMKDEK